jgi:hypothetical protein
MLITNDDRVLYRHEREGLYAGDLLLATLAGILLALLEFESSQVSLLWVLHFLVVTMAILRMFVYTWSWEFHSHIYPKIKWEVRTLFLLRGIVLFWAGVTYQATQTHAPRTMGILDGWQLDLILVLIFSVIGARIWLKMPKEQLVLPRGG